jgi:hypothetical protein
MSDSCHIRKYIESGVMSADVTGAAIDSRFYRVATFTAQWGATGTPVGVFYVQGCGQNPVETTSPQWYTYYIDENKYTISGASWATGAITLTGGAGFLSVTLEPVHPWIRVFYDFSGGAANTSLNVQAHLRNM